MNKIIKNTLYLFIRLLFTTFLAFFSTRIILNSLGVIDFGIYNVIAGAVVLFSFFNNAMSSSTQRHLSYEVVKGTEDSLCDLFNASLRIHILIAIVALILSETIGLYFVKHALTIPIDRIDAALFVYQFVVLIFVCNILSIPYQAVANSRENMGLIAIMGVYEGIAKLAVAFLLAVFSMDKLILYGGLLFVISFSVLLMYFFVCTKKYKESHIRMKRINAVLYKELTGFAGWTLFGIVASLVRRQGSTIMLNVFFGPGINAAFGIASQISNQISLLADTLMKTVNPQIVKSYSMNEKTKMFNLLFLSSRFSFFLFAIVAIPLYLEMDFVLHIWLKEVPDYTLVFSRLILFNVLIDVLIGPLITSIQATGNIKGYSLVSGTVFLLNIPAIFIFLRLGFSPQSVLYSNIAFTSIVGIIRILFLKKLINLSLIHWLNSVLFKSLLYTIVVASFTSILFYYLEDTIISFFSVFLFSFIISIPVIYYLGINSVERIVVNGFVLKRLGF